MSNHKLTWGGISIGLLIFSTWLFLYKPSTTFTFKIAEKDAVLHEGCPAPQVAGVPRVVISITEDGFNFREICYTIGKRLPAENPAGKK